MSRPRVASLVAVTISALLLAGCSGPSQPAPGSSPPGTPARGSPGPSPTPAPVNGSVRVVRTVATGLDVPWGIALLPGGRDIMITSRDSRAITKINISTGRKTLVGTITQARSNGKAGGEAGLLGLVPAPDFARSHRLYVYYSTDRDNRIARLSYDPHLPPGDQLGDPQLILTGIPHGTIHNGGRLSFGPDGMLYAGTGESGDSALAQDRSSLGGKILRMTPTGRPAPGNPFPHSVVWSYGHRNVQGLAWDPAGRLWASEFGASAYDELNLIQKGHNYGWPQTQGRTDIKRFTSPVAQWGTEEDSPSGIAYAGGSIWMAALQGRRLWRIPLAGATVAGRPEDFLVGRYGRLRSVLALNADTLLITTSNTDGRGTPRPGDDRILELRVR